MLPTLSKTGGSHHVRALAAALTACAVLAGGCGGRSTDATSTGSRKAAEPAAARTLPDVLGACGAANRRWRPLRVGALDAAVLGDAGEGVVLLNDSSNDACSWLPLVERLVTRGYRVAVFRYASVAADEEQRAVHDTLRVAAALAQGGGRTALVGASLGGRIVFEATARHDNRIAAIVSLSGERTVEDYGDILGAVRRVRTPLLYVGSRDDDLTDGARQPHQLQRAVGSTTKHLILVPGAAHGTDLLSGDDGHRLSDRVERFLDAQLG